MKIDAVGVTTSNLKRTVEFYSHLGFSFTEFDSHEEHVEAINIDGSARLMIDSKNIIKSILGLEPKPSNHSSFAIRYDNPEQINQVTTNLKNFGFKIVKMPWNAEWGQKYAIVEDPDGYKVDLYCPIVVN